ncbi:MAG: hypothetical protein ACJ8CR_20360 [Roseiflexaceae bacterium]
MTVETIIPKYAPSSDGNAPTRYVQAIRQLVDAWSKQAATSRWQCINPKGVNARLGPRQSFPIARTIEFNEIIEVDEVKTNGDVETIKGDNRWLHAARGEGFTWAGNFRRS